MHAPAIVLNPVPAKLSYLYFHPLEVVSRYRDTQLQWVTIYMFHICYVHMFI